MATALEKIADFGVNLHFEDLPREVVHESKRMLLDSIGCALAGLSIDKGKIAVEAAKKMGGPGEATIIGTGDAVSCFAAAFANGELMNALDYDVCIIPGGHVAPGILPAMLALAEKGGASGKSLISAMAAGNEISARFGYCLGYHRDPEHLAKAKSVGFAEVSGYASQIFGALGSGMLLGLDSEEMTNALGLVGNIVPVQAQTKFFRTPPPAGMQKYCLMGWMNNTILVSVLLASCGYKSDAAVLEGDYGFWRFVGSYKWDPARLLDKLGTEWLMLPITVYKPYPACRCLHTAMGCLRHIIKENKLLYQLNPRVLPPTCQWWC